MTSKEKGPVGQIQEPLISFLIDSQRFECPLLNIYAVRPDNSFSPLWA
jgi:hypothetical protein